MMVFIAIKHNLQCNCKAKFEIHYTSFNIINDILKAIAVFDVIVWTGFNLTMKEKDQNEIKIPK